MQKIIFFILLTLVTNFRVGAQGYNSKQLDAIAKQIQHEGLLLYNSEAASWYGTDIFLAQCGNCRENIGGYFSYPDGLLTKCIFYTKDSTPKVMGTITFDTSYSVNKGIARIEERDFTPTEQSYFDLRKIVMNILSADTFFKYYKNTDLNIVPLIDGKRKDVYIMTGTSQSGLALFGNDYLLQFDQSNQLIHKTALHLSLIQMKYPNAEKNTKGSIHTHLPEYSPFMTPTDICIAKLYEPLTGYNQYTTVSDLYISIWNGTTLTIIPRENQKK